MEFCKLTDIARKLESESPTITGYMHVRVSRFKNLRD